jgi:hypothetical protein
MSIARARALVERATGHPPDPDAEVSLVNVTRPDPGGLAVVVGSAWVSWRTPSDVDATITQVAWDERALGAWGDLLIMGGLGRLAAGDRRGD